MLIEQTLFGEHNKVAEAIERLKAFEPKDGKGYWLAFSGGKDSVTVKALCDLAGVKYEAHYSVTSVDPPELVRFIKDKYPDVSMDIPRDDEGNPITMWNLIPKKLMPPTRLVRYCCAELKESAGEGRLTVTGVRWAESVNRKENQGLVTAYEPKSLGSDDFKLSKRGGYVLNNDNAEARQVVEACYKWRKMVLNPIIDWLDEDVWEFIHKYNVPYCELYDRGAKRIGCIGCPMNTAAAAAELERYPKYRQAYLKAFERMIAERKSRGLAVVWQTGEEVMNWWLKGDKPPKQIEGQMELEL